MSAQKGHFVSEKTKKKISEQQRKPITWIVNENGCHICTSHKPHKTGYPFLHSKGKKQSLQRFLYEQKYGKIPKDLVMRHICDERMCINLEHLLLGTHADNVRDTVNRNRFPLGIHRKHTKLTEQQVLEIFNSKEKTKNIIKKFGIAQSTIWQIQNRKRWNWLTQKNR